jgi:hypothetical protein
MRFEMIRASKNSSVRPRRGDPTLICSSPMRDLKTLAVAVGSAELELGPELVLVAVSYATV